MFIRGMSRFPLSSKISTSGVVQWMASHHLQSAMIYRTWDACGSEEEGFSKWEVLGKAKKIWELP